MAILTRAAILAVDDLAAELVEVPEWGGAVYVRVMTVAERFKFEAVFERDRTRAVPVLLAFTLADEAGRALFTAEDIDGLEAKNCAVILRLFTIAQRKNGLTPEDIEELQKKSEASPALNSHSA